MFKSVIEYLEFLTEDLPFYETFTIPKPTEDRMTHVGRRGKAVDPFYSLDDGLVGAGSLSHIKPKGATAVRDIGREFNRVFTRFRLNHGHLITVYFLIASIFSASVIVIYKRSGGSVSSKSLSESYSI